MSKYNPLSDRFAASAADEWGASFSELESVLGFPLPKAARTSRAWWGNDPEKSHSRAWAIHGWEVGDVDHLGERVVFRRSAASGAELAAAMATPKADRTPDPLSAPPPQPAPASEVQPPAMREAAESASARMHVNRALGATAMVTAGVAAIAGVGALLVRAVVRRR